MAGLLSSRGSMHLQMTQREFDLLIGEIGFEIQICPLFTLSLFGRENGVEIIANYFRIQLRESSLIFLWDLFLCRGSFWTL